MKLLVPCLLGCFAIMLPAVASPASDHPAVGKTVPAVTVRTDKSASVSLRAALGSKPTVLIFYRGGWCPFCTRHLAALAEAEADLRAAGFQLLAISPDRPEKLRARPSHQNLPYTLLSDSEMNAAKAFAIDFKVEDSLVARYKESHGI
ncbi:MAG: redoxin domain-containing protein, partial [Opitutus sp.]